MSVVRTVPTARPRILPSSGVPTRQRPTAERQPTGRGETVHLLILTIVALLGLAAVTVSFVPLTVATGDSRLHWRGTGVSHDGISEVSPLPADDVLLQTLVRPRKPVAEPALHDLPLFHTTHPPKSPLYPQNGVTLWDRIRVSSKRDRRAFLLGTAIQLHAPATAATPGPRHKASS